LGDLRSLPLLEASHVSVELFRAEDSMDRERLRRQVDAALAAEPELVFHPALFSALARRLPRITHVEIQLRRGWADNELTRFRYDAVLHVERPAPPEPDWLDWGEVRSLAALRDCLLAGPDLLAVRGLPNERVREDVAALALLADPDGPRTAAELRRAASVGEPGLHPETVWELGEELGYAVGVTWSADPGRFDAVFQRSEGLLPGLLPGLAPAAPPDLAGLANDPLQRKAAQKIVPVLRALCEERLPAWMVPADIVVLEALPVTIRGKVDLKALPAPERERPGPVEETVLPQTSEERALASLWSELLGVERVGLNDNFFALGGHSLLATQVVSRVRQAFAVELPLRHLFEAPTIAGLAARLRAALATAGRLALPPVTPVPREGDLPLSFGQQRLWFLHRMDPAAPGYLMAGAFRLDGVLSVSRLSAALSEVVRRHEVLRSTYHEGPVQRIHPPRPVFLPVVDLSGVGESEVQRLAREEAGRPFDLERDLMVRGALLRLGEREHVALLTLHHIASDGWSVDVLVRELAVLYGTSLLPELPIQYGDFAVWQRRWLDGPVLEGQLVWWKERLAGVLPVLELPTDRPRPPVRTGCGGRRTFAVAPDLDLQGLATREGTTLFVLLLAAWQTLLARITHQQDLVVGTPVAGRRQAETEDLIGFFVNTLVLRATAEDAPFRDFLARVHGGALDAFSHQDLPFERLVEELRPERSLAYTPVFQVTFALRHASRVPLELPGLTLQQLPFEPDAKFDLELALAETEHGLEGTLDFAADLFDPATAERLAGLYGNLLREIAAAPERRLSDFKILSEAERHQLAEWGRGAALAAEGTVLDLFDAQVERTPDATAVVAEDVSLTYRDLERRSDDVARRLADRIRPGDVVGLQVERSADLAVGILGIWKAGAVFLPIDPSYPAERVDLMVRDSGCAFVVGAQFIAPLEAGAVRGATGGAMNCAPTT
ncbi:MAG TPA: condensation domain-containing protein, partial [Thermoanaerobaculia bacterium]|nr:condensation domain-containing protein [Thermoanaerobaculia bacterium]